MSINLSALKLEKNGLKSDNLCCICISTGNRSSKLVMYHVKPETNLVGDVRDLLEDFTHPFKSF